jgi:hypothetical protein
MRSLLPEMVYETRTQLIPARGGHWFLPQPISAGGCKQLRVTLPDDTYSGFRVAVLDS